MTTNEQKTGGVGAQIRAHVTGHVGQLQSRYLAKDPRARAVLAELRRASPSSDQGTLQALTLGFKDVPESLIGQGDEPTRAEKAIATALSLYAVHQQSLTEGAHRSGQGLGKAVRSLANPADAESREKPVMRRFNALATAANTNEALHHLRGLVQQFRAEKIPLDYGQLAEDLYWLQGPAGRTRVRLRWARDLARLDAKQAGANPSIPTIQATETPEQ